MWIEIKLFCNCVWFNFVIPFVGMWIEIGNGNNIPQLAYRHPLCGDVNWNPNLIATLIQSCFVIPFVGMWIEISLSLSHNLILVVIPFVGMWIEIGIMALAAADGLGHPLCGDVNWNNI